MIWVLLLFLVGPTGTMTLVEERPAPLVVEGAQIDSTSVEACLERGRLLALVFRTTRKSGVTLSWGCRLTTP